MNPVVKLLALLLTTALLSVFGIVRAGEEPRPDDSANATRDNYPAIRTLDFALGRKGIVSIELRDDYNCPKPIQTHGLTLAKPEELPIDLATVLKLAGCDNLDFR